VFEGFSEIRKLGPGGLVGILCGLGLLLLSRYSPGFHEVWFGSRNQAVLSPLLTVAGTAVIGLLVQGVVQRLQSRVPDRLKTLQLDQLNADIAKTEAETEELKARARLMNARAERIERALAGAPSEQPTPRPSQLAEALQRSANPTVPAPEAPGAVDEHATNQGRGLVNPAPEKGKDPTAPR
jgi:hypothetical protein